MENKFIVAVSRYYFWTKKLKDKNKEIKEYYAKYGKEGSNGEWINTIIDDYKKIAQSKADYRDDGSWQHTTREWFEDMTDEIETPADEMRALFDLWDERKEIKHQVAISKTAIFHLGKNAIDEEMEKQFIAKSQKNAG